MVATFLFLIVSICTLASCATSPLGRKQLALLPDSQLNQMGEQTFAALKRETPSETNPEILAYVKCVTMPLTKQVSGAHVPASWEVVVFRDPQVNAFALPGGKIGVYTGMITQAKTDAQLAAVIGHEIGHVVAQHSNERVSESLLAAGGLAAFEQLMSNKSNAGLWVALVGAGAQFGVLLPHSRTHELEADQMGLSLMAAAGFDPREAPELWRGMSAKGGGQPPEFLSTHPSHENRIQRLEAAMPEALAVYEKVKTTAGTALPVCVRPKI